MSHEIAYINFMNLTTARSSTRAIEIGIRKVMGASVSGITILLTRDFMKWIIVANVIAWPTAYFAMNKWLQNYAYRTSIGVGIFILAAVANPVDSLRYE